MDSINRRLVQRKIKVKDIDAHPTEDAIVISYQVEATLMSDEDRLMGDAKNCQKIIHLHKLNEVEDIESLANGLVDRVSGLIEVNQVSQLVYILNYLKKRRSNGELNGKLDQLRPRTASSRLDNYMRSKTSMEVEKKERHQIRVLSNDFWKDVKMDRNMDVSMQDIDSYLEMLYDEEQKLEGLCRIFLLTEAKDNLKDLSESESLVGVLVRMFREESKKNLNLGTLLAAIFAQFSFYLQFHSVLSQHKCGSQCLDLVQLEMKKDECSFQELIEIQKKNTNQETRKFTPTSEYEKALKRYQTLVKKQNHFLKACYLLLLNISEDKKVEIKMVNKNIIGTLIKSLEREAPAEFFIILLTFLTKLSIFEENKNQMMELSIVDKLYILLSSTIQLAVLDTRLLQSTLALLYNLSFDHKLRSKMINIGILPKLLYLWSKDKLQGAPSTEKLLLSLLYQMSYGKKVRGLFNFSFGLGVDSIDVIMTRVMRTLELSGSKGHPNLMEMMALVINLSLHEKNAKKMCENGRLQGLLNEVFRGNLNEPKTLSRVLTVKLLRNLSIFAKDHKIIFEEYVEAICQSVFRKDIFNRNLASKMDAKQTLKSDLEETFVIESLGILGNLINSNIDWLTLQEKFEIWEWSKVRMNPAFGCEDDLILEIIVFIGTCCTQESSAKKLTSYNDFFDLLLKLLHSKQDDDEIVLQLVFIVFVLSSHSSLRKTILGDPRVMLYLIELMNDKNLKIRIWCNEVFLRLSQEDSELGKKVKLEKFKTHNKKWIELMSKDGDMSFEEASNEEEFPINPDFEDEEFNRMLRSDVDLLNSSSDSPTGSNTSTPSRMAWDFSTEPMDSRTRPVSVRPTTGYKRRTRVAD